MTYRIGAHSTSDDDSKYRTQQSPEVCTNAREACASRSASAACRALRAARSMGRRLALLD
eukprot:6101982-Pleurochrysis_carterae.AAC.2